MANEKGTLADVVQDILADNIIEDSELETLKKHLQANGNVSKEEGEAVLGLLKWQVFTTERQAKQQVENAKKMETLVKSLVK
jgi:hypothetical protein